MSYILSLKHTSSEEPTLKAELAKALTKVVKKYISIDK